MTKLAFLLLLSLFSSLLLFQSKPSTPTKPLVFTHVTVIDATGRNLTSSSVATGSSSTSVPLQNANGPYRLELQGPGRPFDIHVHLDLKDLPLP